MTDPENNLITLIDLHQRRAIHYRLNGQLELADVEAAAALRLHDVLYNQGEPDHQGLVIDHHHRQTAVEIAIIAAVIACSILFYGAVIAVAYEIIRWLR
jgi:nanoRNase/pAp phosphatase (c-di-AMP/oligoRNAs hydrolase)